MRAHFVCSTQLPTRCTAWSLFQHLFIVVVIAHPEPIRVIMISVLRLDDLERRVSKKIRFRRAQDLPGGARPYQKHPRQIARS
jgi:hypothetical protein